MSDKPGTSVQQKIDSKKAAYRYKLGKKDSKLIDLLRQKCKIRVKESRDNGFNQSRNFSPENKKQIVKSVISEEFSNSLDADIELQEAIYKELIEEIDDWLGQEFEREEDYLVAQFQNQMENNPICPVCKKQNLVLVDVHIICACGVKLAWYDTIETFHNLILAKVQDHEKCCNSVLQFYTEPVCFQEKEDHQSFHTICESCAYYSIIID